MTLHSRYRQNMSLSLLFVADLDPLVYAMMTSDRNEAYYLIIQATRMGLSLARHVANGEQEVARILGQETGEGSVASDGRGELGCQRHFMS